MTNFARQLGGYSNPNATNKYKLPKFLSCSATLYVFPQNKNTVPGIGFLINVEAVKYGRELNGLGSVTLSSDMPQKFVPLIQWETAPQTFAQGVFRFAGEVGQRLQDPASIPMPKCAIGFSFTDVTVVSGAPWDKGCDPRDYSQYNDRINRPRVRSTTDLEEVTALILNAVFDAVCGTVNGENQPQIQSWPKVTNPYLYLPEPYLDVSLER